MSRVLPIEPLTRTAFAPFGDVISIDDARHFAIVKLGDTAITARSFAQWSMGFEAGGEPSDNATLAHQVETLVRPLADANLRAYFTGFAKSHSSA